VDVCQHYDEALRYGCFELLSAFKVQQSALVWSYRFKRKLTDC
jgi:hypothetical protein